MSTKANILIIDDIHEQFMHNLDKLGMAYKYAPHITRHELLNELENYNCLVVRSKTIINKEVIDAGENLQLIARAGSGMDGIDLTYAESKGITCINTPEANANAVGEQTIAMLLALLTNVAKADREVRNKVWDREGNRGYELSGKTVAIVGYGNTGSHVARKLSGFDVTVLAFDKYKKGYADKYIKESTMDEIFEQADVLTLHVPLNDETEGMVNETYMNKFKKDFYLLNLSRGKVVNTADLVKALNTGKIKGAALDVLENEKIETLNDNEQLWFKALINNNRVVLAPHVGGWTFESYKKTAEWLCTKIMTYYN